MRKSDVGVLFHDDTDRAGREQHLADGRSHMKTCVHDAPIDPLCAAAHTVTGRGNDGEAPGAKSLVLTHSYYYRSFQKKKEKTRTTTGQQEARKQRREKEGWRHSVDGSVSAAAMMRNFPDGQEWIRERSDASLGAVRSGLYAWTSAAAAQA